MIHCAEVPEAGAAALVPVWKGRGRGGLGGLDVTFCVEKHRNDRAGWRGWQSVWDRSSLVNPYDCRYRFDRATCRGSGLGREGKIAAAVPRLVTHPHCDDREYDKCSHAWKVVRCQDIPDAL